MHAHNPHNTRAGIRQPWTAVSALLGLTSTCRGRFLQISSFLLHRLLVVKSFYLLTSFLRFTDEAVFFSSTFLFFSVLLIECLPLFSIYFCYFFIRQVFCCCFFVVVLFRFSYLFRFAYATICPLSVHRSNANLISLSITYLGTRKPSVFSLRN